MEASYNDEVNALPGRVSASERKDSVATEERDLKCMVKYGDNASCLPTADRY